MASVLLLIGTGDFGILFLIELRQTIGGPLGGRRLEIVIIARFLLEGNQDVPHVIQDVFGKGLTLGSGDVFPHKVHTGLVHTYQPDRRKMVLPIFIEPFLDIPEIIFRVGIEIPLSKIFQDLSLGLQAFFCEVHQPLQTLQKFTAGLAQMAESGHVDRDDADGSCQGIGPKEPPSPLLQFPVVNAQPAAHTPGIFGIHVRIDKVGKIRYTVFGRHLPERIEIPVFPVEVSGDIVCGNREGEYPSLGITLGHDLKKGPIEQVHLLLKIPIGFLPGRTAHNDILIRIVAWYGDIEGHIREGGLEANPGGYVNIEDELLEGLFYLIEIQTIISDEGGQQRIEVREGLGTSGFPLKGIEKVNHLSQSTPEVLGRLALHLAGHTPETFHEQVV
jgi:hypothetical protein